MTETRTPSAWPDSVDRSFAWIIDGAGVVAAWSGLALVMIVSGNVLLRYVFNTGSIAMQEMEWHLVSPIALFGMAYGMRHGGHVRVDFLYDRLGPRAQAAVNLLSALLMLGMGIAMIVFAVPYVDQSYAMGEGSADPGGLPYRWVLKAFIPLGFGLLAVQALAETGRSLGILGVSGLPFGGIATRCARLAVGAVTRP